MFKIVLATAVATTLLPTDASAQGTYTQIVPDGTFEQAVGISPNGEYVVGGGGSNGFLWSEAGGLVTGLGAPIAGWGVTSDGEAIVGTSVNGSGDVVGAVWTPSTGVTFPANAGGAIGCGSELTDLNGVSADGTTAVGLSWQGCTTSPMRWTQGVGTTLLTKQSATSGARCYAVSDDGQVSVGWDTGLPSGSTGSRRASVWLDDNTQFFPTTTPGNPNGNGEVTDVNSDGSVVCGTALGSAFVWTQSNGLQPLPKVADQPGSHIANGVSEDGSVVVGVYFLGGFPPTSRAFIWTAATGTVDLADHMTAQGITGFPAADIDNATGVSADGTVICGWGGFKAWVVSFDGPWADLGNALAGINGEPSLDGTGDLTANSPVTITLDNAAPSASTFLVLGFSNISASFKGGTLVPSADIIFSLTTSPSGTLSLPGTWPAGVPSAFTAYFQTWIVDAAGPAGFAATNGLSATTP